MADGTKELLFTSLLLLWFLRAGLCMYTVDGPALPGRPFVTVWNAKSQVCQTKWNVSIDLSAFDIVDNSNQSWYGQFMNIFYSDKLGLYPHFDYKGRPVNGGLPQLANVTAHLEKSAHDIITIIPDPDFKGLAVIDWEAWRPLFIRNFDSLSIYKEKSEELVRKEHPTWSEAKVKEESQKEFEAAARNLFESTLTLGIKLRPKAFWGYYHFPYCYNHELEPKAGWDCKQSTKDLNDKISWLFDASTTLYPSVYLPDKRIVNTTAFVGYRVLEGLRLAKRGEFEVPVFPYVRFVYEKSELFLNEEDAMAAISVPAMLGSAGIVIWGSGNDTKTWIQCIELKNYVEMLLGPLVKIVTKAATDCSEKFCSSHGRCARKFNKDKPMKLDFFAEDIACKCYRGWTGPDCSKDMFA